MKKHHKLLLVLSFTSITLLSAAVLANKTVSKVNQNNFPGIGDNQVFLEFKFTMDEKEPQELSILVENGTEGSVKIDGYTFSFRPHIFGKSARTIVTKKVMVTGEVKDDGKTQVLTEISVHQDKQTKPEVSNMSLMSLSNTWASFKMQENEHIKSLYVELRASIHHNEDSQ